MKPGALKLLFSLSSLSFFSCGSQAPSLPINAALHQNYHGPERSLTILVYVWDSFSLFGKIMDLVHKASLKRPEA